MKTHRIKLALHVLLSFALAVIWLCIPATVAYAQNEPPQPPEPPVDGSQAPELAVGGGNLSWLSAAAIGGEANNDEIGSSIADVGDVNGDGFSDLLLGAPYYGLDDMGRAYLFLGGPGGWTLDQNGSGAAAYYTGEAPTDCAGMSVAGAGDVNSDGYDDMLIGAPCYNANQGRVYLILGSASPSSTSLAAANAIYTGDPGSAGSGSSTGNSVAGAGDVNGDGYGDFLIGAYTFDRDWGRVYLILGSASPTSMDLGLSGVVYLGYTENEFAGVSVAGVGDVNGDGYSDVLIGAHGHGTDQGRAYLVLGRISPISIGLGMADAIYTGEDVYNYAGYSVAGAGDVNGDGYSDMLIGAYGYNGSWGRAYLVLGSAQPSSANLNSIEPVYEATGPSEYVGSRVSGAGDVNGDGYADVLISSNGASDSRGRVYLVLGSARPYSISLGAADAQYTGDAYERAGRGLAGAIAIPSNAAMPGDVNGDGYSDLLIGAPWANSHQGRGYVVLSEYGLPGAGQAGQSGYAGFGASYRKPLPSGNTAPTTIGTSGVTIDMASGGIGWVGVTRYRQNTCNREISTNGLLWRVDSYFGGSASTVLAFHYNDRQIYGMLEVNLKLWTRPDPCKPWAEVPGVKPDVDHNRVVSPALIDPHAEFTISEGQPSPTGVQAVSLTAQLQQDSSLVALGMAGVVLLSIGADAWRRRKNI